VKISSQNYYEQCQECEFANFKDSDNLDCSQDMEYKEDESCKSFKKLQQENNQNLIANGKFNQIVEEIYQNAIESEKDKKSEIVLFDNKAINQDTRDENDYRINTIQNVDVYNTPDVILGGKTRTIPKNTLVPYHREIIRAGIELIMLKEPDGSYAYIEKDLKKLRICDQCQVKEKPLDILLMPHEDFTKYIVSNKPEVKQIKTGFEEHINSFIGNENGKTHVRIKDSISKDGKNIGLINLIDFNTLIPYLKIGRLAPNSKFYITSSKGDKLARKIKTADGTEGILISSTETYKVILPALQQIVNFVTIALTFAIVIGIIYTILESTGWIIIIGIAVIAIAYIVAIFIGAPVYFILNQIIKRL